MTTPAFDIDLALRVASVLAPSRTRYAVPVRRGPRLSLDPNPRAPDPTNLAAVRRWVRSGSGPTAIDLFCGAGGLSLGLQASGMRVLVGADNDPLAIETHAANLESLPYLGDLSDPSDLLFHLKAWGIETVDVVAGGVPCQPFSRAGRSKIRSLVAAHLRPPDDSRANLWRSFVQVVEHLQPRAVLLENVPDLATWDEGAVLVGFCEALRQLGYDTTSRVLRAYEYGVPQHRSRLFVVATRHNSRFLWPQPDQGVLPTLWDAIGDLPAVEGGQRSERLPYRRPKTALQKRLRAGVPSAELAWVYDHITRSVRPDDLEAFRVLKPGDTYDDLPRNLQRYRSDIFTDKYKRLSKNGLSRTITAHIARDGYWYIHPVQHRTLSVREAARIQTFPDWFRFAGEPSHRFRQVGNAVPPLLGESVGAAVMTSLTKRSNQSRRTNFSSSCALGSRTHFRDDLLRWHANNGRAYPWRSGASAWSVLLAEMCLHRTRADQVSAIYSELVTIAPDPAGLLANQTQARRLLKSLGLQWRVENIVNVARVLVDVYGGEVPETREDLRGLPGVGDYVANSVLCFAFNQPSVLMDTNTERIASRVAGRDRSAPRWQLRLDLYDIAGPVGADQNFNYALLDLGALVCRSTAPRCRICPVSNECKSFQAARS